MPREAVRIQAFDPAAIDTTHRRAPTSARHMQGGIAILSRKPYSALLRYHLQAWLPSRQRASRQPMAISVGVVQSGCYGDWKRQWEEKSEESIHGDERPEKAAEEVVFLHRRLTV